MSTAAGAGLRAAAAAAAGVGKSLWLSYAFAGSAGDAPRTASPGTGRPGPHRTFLPTLAVQGQSGLGSQESQPRNQRTDSPTALAATASRPAGSPGCAARDVAGAASAPGTSSRDAPRPSRPLQSPLLCHPQPGGQCWCSCHSGRPAYCSGPTAVPALREKRPSPDCCGAAGPDGRLRAEGELAGTGKSCSEGRRRWVVGGGGGWGRR